MRTRNKILIAVGAVFVIVVIALNFSSVDPGKRISTVKTFASPKEALFSQVAAAAVPVSRDLGLVRIDGTNAVYVAETERGEVVAAGMWVRDGKYFYSGSFVVASSDVLRSGEGSDEADAFLYGEDGKCTGSLRFALTAKKPVGGNAEPVYGAETGTVYLVWTAESRKS